MKRVQPASASSPTGDPWLLTPGPLTTSPEVKQAMLHDYGSRDRYFVQVNNRIRKRLIDLVNGRPNHVCILMQGSGTFVVEAMLISLVPRDGKILLLINGAYGQRMARICEYHNRSFEVDEYPENQPIDPAVLDQRLKSDSAITHVGVVYCETTSGIENPIQKLSDITRRQGRSFLIDAMSAFGALPLDAQKTNFDAVVASSNKCLEGSPGIGFCITPRNIIEHARGHSDTLVLDLYDQWQAMESNGQWRFTPPTHAVLAMDQALNELDAEGGVGSRSQRYRQNCELLISGMREIGFQTLLPDAIQAPIIVTFLMPTDPNFYFDRFYDELRDKGYVIYPGKLTVANSFRIGCIGRIDTKQINGVLSAVRNTLNNMGVRNCGPK
jgi:2-aminoethylphosphonate-pyruvate transaminase